MTAPIFRNNPGAPVVSNRFSIHLTNAMQHEPYQAPIVECSGGEFQAKVFLDYFLSEKQRREVYRHNVIVKSLIEGRNQLFRGKMGKG